MNLIGVHLLSCLLALVIVDGAKAKNIESRNDFGNFSKIDKELTNTCSDPPQVTYGEASHCRGAEVGSFCSPCCNVGLQTEIRPMCVSVNQWEPDKVSCVGQVKCINKVWTYRWNPDGMPMIPVVSCRNELYYGCTFDLERRLPFYTVYQFTERNLVSVPNRGSWALFRCNENDLRSKQFEEYTLIPGYDRGHLANNADIRFTRDAVRSTYKYINAVPQDPYSNEQPWNYLEDFLRWKFSQAYNENEIRRGIVITGVCLTHKESNGVKIPDCVWKLACTRTNEGEYTVAGFYHQNVLSTSETQKGERNDEIYQIRNQGFLNDFRIRIDPTQLWTDVMPYFTNEVKYVIVKCMDAGLIIPPSPSQPDGNNLYQFWYSNTNDKDAFGQDFRFI